MGVHPDLGVISSGAPTSTRPGLPVWRSYPRTPDIPARAAPALDDTGPILDDDFRDAASPEAGAPPWCGAACARGPPAAAGDPAAHGRPDERARALPRRADRDPAHRRPRRGRRRD